MSKEHPEKDPIKRLVCPAKDAKSVIDLDSMTPADLVRWIAAQTGMKYNEIGDKAFLDPTALVTKTPPVIASPQLPPTNALGYPSGVHVARHPDNNASKYRTTGASTAAPLVQGPDSTKLSEHFTLGEFACHDRQTYTGVRVHPNLVKALEKIRARAGGRPIKILSAYRPPAYNQSIGGVSNSQHIDGIAADIYIEGVSTADLYDHAQAVIQHSGGVGYYPASGFVHVDVRGYEARWTG